MNEVEEPITVEKGVFINWSRRKAGVSGGEWPRKGMWLKRSEWLTILLLIQVREENAFGSGSMVILEFKRTTSKVWHHLRSGKNHLERYWKRGNHEWDYGDPSTVANIDNEIWAVTMGQALWEEFDMLIHLLFKENFKLQFTYNMIPVSDA